MSEKTPREIVQNLLDRGFQLVFWPDKDDWKGPRTKGWEEKQYTIADYHDGDRVGIKSGVEIEPGRFIVDVDIDFGGGVEIAKALLPVTEFIWGRPGKRVSHCLYTVPEAVPMFTYKDVGPDKTAATLIEFRSAPKHESMAPPSVWQKGDKREQLAFIFDGKPAHIESADALKHRVRLAAIGMLLGIHLGKNGFGHEPRLAWAGFLMRLGVSDEDLRAMGLAISRHCNNLEEEDVWRVIQSTRINLNVEGKKVKGGPALAKIIGENGKAVISRINEWVGRDGDFIRDQKGAIVVRSQENVRRAVELLGYDLSYDQFADKLQINGHPMEDHEVEHIWFQIDQDYHFLPPWDFFKQKIRHIAWQNAYHPVKDYLRKLEWDGVPRVDDWLIRCADAEDTPYVRAVSSIMLIAAVRRIFHPGCKYDEMVVWESPQGIGKSSAAQALCPNPAWFSDDLSLTLRSQQLIEATLGKWIIEVSELAGKRKAEQDQLKAMLSRAVDGPARMAYAHFPVERARHFILLGTTNPTGSGYLSDSTGARRWWPIKVKRFDVGWIVANRDQLWAEAVAREARGESIRLAEELWPVAAEQQNARREIDPWESIIRAAVLAIPPSGDGRRRVVTEGLWAALSISTERRDRYGATRISEIMQRLGFYRSRVRDSAGEAAVGYVQEADKLRLLEHVDGEQDQESDFGSVKPVNDTTPF